ncbi:MAG: hypothetical protein AAF802_11240 [Planctomycetota bacterium]
MIRFAGLALLSATLSAGVARAELTIAYSVDDGNSFSSEVDIREGESVEIEIYARQSEPETVLLSEGLIAFGLDLTIDPRDLGRLTEASVNQQFDLENVNLFTETGFEWEFGVGNGIGVSGDEILLGSFEFESTSIGTTEITVGDRLVGTGIGNASWLTPTPEILDQRIFGANSTDRFSFFINATAIPEPSSCFIVGGLFGAATLRRGRRKSRS